MLDGDEAVGAAAVAEAGSAFAIAGEQGSGDDDAWALGAAGEEAGGGVAAGGEVVPVDAGEIDGGVFGACDDGWEAFGGEPALGFGAAAEEEPDGAGEEGDEGVETACGSGHGAGGAGGEFEGETCAGEETAEGVDPEEGTSGEVEVAVFGEDDDAGEGRGGSGGMDGCGDDFAGFALGDAEEAFGLEDIEGGPERGAADVETAGEDEFTGEGALVGAVGDFGAEDGADLGC